MVWCQRSALDVLFCFLWYIMVTALYPGRPEQMMGLTQGHEENREARYVSQRQLNHRGSSMKLLRVPLFVHYCVHFVYFLLTSPRYATRLQPSDPSGSSTCLERLSRVI